MYFNLDGPARVCYLADKLEFEYYDFMSDYRSPWVFNKILQKP